MRTAVMGALVGFVALGLLACEEPKKKAYVEGEFEISSAEDEFSFQGSLAEGGADYYGYCHYSKSNETFEFEVGDAKKANISSPTQLYVKFLGIDGPPVEGVYEDAVAKIPKDLDVKIGFGTGSISNGGNDFVFAQPDDDTSCYVELFAKAVAGEVTLVAEKEFTYYVSFHCTNLEGVASGDQELTSFYGHFYFKGCN
jgi:hypothetical protein